MKRIVLSLFAAVLFSACAHHQPKNSVPQPPYHGTKAELPLGTVLGCARQLTQYGFTKEECGKLWGANIEIEVQ